MSSVNHKPPVSFGSFMLAVMILLVGYLATDHNQAEGITGWRAYWPVITAGVLTVVVNVLAIVSPDGSVFALAKEIWREWRASK